MTEFCKWPTGIDFQQVQAEVNGKKRENAFFQILRHETNQLNPPCIGYAPLISLKRPNNKKGYLRNNNKWREYDNWP